MSMSVATIEGRHTLIRRSVWEHLRQGPLRIAIIGSGNWGSAIAKIIGLNARKAFFFEDTVKMYVHEEDYKGRKLTEVINEQHENVKYLAGIKLPENIIACPNLRETVAGAHILVFVMPHQFIKSLCAQMQGHIVPGAKAISLVKGFDCENNKINLISEYVRSILGVECSSLSGANVAEGVAREEFSETTIGYDDIESAQLFQQLFDMPYFRVNAVPDVAGVELCGALKNIIALAAGFVDGLKMGSNTKAAILRIGMLEMRKFAGMFYSNTIDEVFWDSAGLADLLTTCQFFALVSNDSSLIARECVSRACEGYGGRNRKCAEAFVTTGKSWKVIEKEMLNGQKLQGTHTCRDVNAFLTAQGKRDHFPLFSTIYDIVDQGLDPKCIVTVFMSSMPRAITKSRTLVSNSKL